MEAPYTRRPDGKYFAQIVYYGVAYRIISDNPAALMDAALAAKSMRNAWALLGFVVTVASLMMILSHAGQATPFAVFITFLCWLNLKSLISGTVRNAGIASKWRRFCRMLAVYEYAQSRIANHE